MVNFDQAYRDFCVDPSSVSVVHLRHLALREGLKFNGNDPVWLNLTKNVNFSVEGEDWLAVHCEPYDAGIAHLVVKGYQDVDTGIAHSRITPFWAGFKQQDVDIETATQTEAYWAGEKLQHYLRQIHYLRVDNSPFQESSLQYAHILALARGELDSDVEELELINSFLLEIETHGKVRLPQLAKTVAMKLLGAIGGA